jgi:hypothetical protein
MRCKIVGRCLQTMVNMYGADLAWPFFCTCQQQSGGIGSAAVTHRQWQIWLKTGDGLV